GQDRRAGRRAEDHRQGRRAADHRAGRHQRHRQRDRHRLPGGTNGAGLHHRPIHHGHSHRGARCRSGAGGGVGRLHSALGQPAHRSGQEGPQLAGGTAAPGGTQGDRADMTTVPVPSAALTVGRQGNYAGAVSRLAAFAADVGASWGLYTLGVALLNAALKLVTGHSFTLSNHQLVAFIVLTVWEFLYFAYQWSVSGKTLGMAVLGLQVVTAQGGPISGRQAVFRTVGLGITLFLTLGIGFLGIVFQRNRRALNDFIAGTAVVYDWDARAARLRWIARKEGPLADGPA